MDLQEILNLSYADREKQKREMAKRGYNYDSMLSNGNTQIYYNPRENKLLNTVTGTHNLSDWGTDAYLAMGHLKDTTRYKEADRALKEAKRKYGVNNAIVAGHSLGGSIASQIASKNDKAFALDAGYTIGQKTRSYGGNHQNYRTSGDVVSLLSGNAKHMKTLENPHGSGLSQLARNVGAGLVHPLLGLQSTVSNVLKSHDINSVKDKIRVPV